MNLFMMHKIIDLERITQFVLKLGFLVNPIAGIGGKVGLKGSDGPDTLRKAREMGGEPLAEDRAMQFLSALNCLNDLEIYTCGGSMGQDLLEKANIKYAELVIEPGDVTVAEDTLSAVRQMESRGVGLIGFCGGDGTARDMHLALSGNIPILGIPAGVKVYSSVFALGPATAASTVCEFARGGQELAEAEIMDLDEEGVRAGEPGVRVKLHGTASVPFDPTSMQRAKSPSTPEEKEFSQAIAKTLVEDMENDGENLYILGPGSVKKAILHELGLEGSFLGVDAVRDCRMVGLDLNEKGILELLDLLDEDSEARIVVTPIGAQGFVLGRGNHQISPEVLTRVGSDNISIVASPQKLARTPRLFVQTGNPALDNEIAGFRKILMGYRTWEMRKIEGV